MKTTLMAAASALMLSAGIASAAPAVTESAVNVRSGPGTQYAVVATLPGGATVDVGDCTGNWCPVSWNAGSGYVNAGYLDMAGGPGPVAIDPGYYDNTPDYGTYAGSDYGVYGPGLYGPGGVRHHRHGHVGDNRWQHNPGRPAMTAQPIQPRPGFTAHTRNFGTDRGTPHMGAPHMGTPHMGTPHMSAPVGLHTGGPSIGMHAGPSIGARGPSVGARPAGPKVVGHGR